MTAYERRIDGHTERLVVTRAEAGWEIRSWWDNAMVNFARVSDWHRVERVVALFQAGLVPVPAH
jgi:hypothetical protein